MTWPISLHWRHNEHDGVSNYQPHDCLRNCLFKRRSKKISKLRVTGLCAGNSPVTDEFPSQQATNAENASIWYVIIILYFHMHTWYGVYCISPLQFHPYPIHWEIYIRCRTLMQRSRWHSNPLLCLFSYVTLSTPATPHIMVWYWNINLVGCMQYDGIIVNSTSHDICTGFVVMMTSSNENIFRVTCPLCGDFTGHRPVTRSFDVFFDLRSL